jgi:hypothetical protein
MIEIATPPDSLLTLALSPQGRGKMEERHSGVHNDLFRDFLAIISALEGL